MTIPESTMPFATVLGFRAPNARWRIAWSMQAHLMDRSIMETMNSQLNSWPCVMNLRCWEPAPACRVCISFGIQPTRLMAMGRTISAPPSMITNWIASVMDTAQAPPTVL